jgi:hypothetical protein
LRSTLALSGLVNNRNEVSYLALTDAKRPTPTCTNKNITSELQNFRTSETQNLRTSELQNFRTSKSQNLKISKSQNCYQARLLVTAQQENASSPSDQAQLANRSSAQRATRAERGIKTLRRIRTSCHCGSPTTVTYKTYRSFEARTVKSLITTPQGWSIA